MSGFPQIGAYVRAPTTGLLSARPAATANGQTYYATDDGGGTYYISNDGSTWTQVGPAGELAYASTTASPIVSNVTNTGTDAPGLSISVTARTRPYYVEAWVGTALSSVGGDVVTWSIYDIGAAATIATGFYTAAVANSGSSIYCKARIAAGAGAKNFKVQVGRYSGTGNINAYGNATYPAFIRATEL